jgi:hypothetical protein
MGDHPMRNFLLHRGILAGASGPILVGAVLLLTPGTAAAQSAAEQLLRQVIPGAGGDAQQVAADAERACERYAKDQRLDVRDILGSRSAGRDEFEVTLRVEDRDDQYDARCFYDMREREVTELEPLEATQARGGRDEEDEVDERLAREARDACLDAAERRDFDDIEVGDARERDRDTVEVTIEARDQGDRLDVTCLYDQENQQAFLSDSE